MGSFDTNLNATDSIDKGCILDEISTTETLSNTNVIKQRYENIKKSPNDERSYRGLILKNDMKVVLVSDPSTERNAAALIVGVGYMSDPDYLPGLAHFCEHMLYLGSEKYPDPKNFDKFLSLCGGTANASTLLDHTNFYFDITSDNFHDGLDRFAQFFVNPLFDESSMESELSAIYSEHEKNLAKDSWRIDQLDASSADPGHPYSKFGSGNKDTLEKIPNERGINLREELLKFYSDWYSSSIMNLSVLGNESLDELEEMVVSMFSGVKNTGISAPEWPEHPFNQDHFQHKWYISIIKDIGALKIIFPLPDMRANFRAGVEIYICHIISNEDEGSLLSVLKEAGWCNIILPGLSAKVARGGCNFLAIAFDITDEGREHIDDIITIAFKYLNMIRIEEPSESLFNEYQQTAQMNFNFSEKSAPEDYVHLIACRLLQFPIEDALHAPYLPTEWRPDLIKSVMNYLIPQNMRVHIIGQNYDDIATETEFWYGTKYLKEKISDHLITKWSDPELFEDFKLPSPNEFIPTTFEIKADENSEIDEHPVVIRDDQIMRIWFKQDDEFQTPKIYLTLDFENPLTYLDPLNSNLTSMYEIIVSDFLSKYSRKIDTAGFYLSIDATAYGITLTMDGYHDKFFVLLEKTLDALMNISIDPIRFEILKETYKRFRKIESDNPYERVNYYLNVLLSDQIWMKIEETNAIEYLTFDRLEQYRNQLFSMMHVEGLVYGNINESEASELIQLIERKLNQNPDNENEDRIIVPFAQRHFMINRQICLDKGCYFLYETNQTNCNESAVGVYYQCGLQSTESNIHLELLAEIISTPCYDKLRNQDQLGYTVLIHIARSNGVQGLKVIVQSEKRPDYVEKRIFNCIESMPEYLISLTDEEFNQYKTTLESTRLEKSKTMGTVFATYSGEISMQTYNFDCDNVEVDYLRTVTKNQIIEFFKEFFCDKSPMRSILVIHVLSSNNKDSELTTDEQKSQELLNDNETIKPIKITNIQVFKASQALFPLLNTCLSIPSECRRDS